MQNPGSAGLTADRLGDAEPWVAEDLLVENLNIVAVVK
jgi:hypothetical protein